MIIPLDQLHKAIDEKTLLSQVGGKAASLGEMINRGIPVPPGHCVLSSGLAEFLDHNRIAPDFAALAGIDPTDEGAVEKILSPTRQQILRGHFVPRRSTELESLYGHTENTAFAVRSSGSKEDLRDASFAGLYTTVLNVMGSAAIIEAIKSCWASLFEYRVYKYFVDQRIDYGSASMAVIIQDMVRPEKSGVLFTVHPVRGEDTAMLIEACFGLSDHLVGGEVTPDQYVFDWRGKQGLTSLMAPRKSARLPADRSGEITQVPLNEAQRGALVLSEAEVKTLAEMALRLQTAAGFPLDIEWVQADGSFYFVQSRPITNMNLSGIDGQWTTADFKDGGVSSAVCSQFMWSLYDFIWERAMPEYLVATKLLDKDDGIVWGDMFFGRPYWNAAAVKECANKVPGFIERQFDEDLGIQVGYAGNGHVTKFSPSTILRGLRVLKALKESFKQRLAAAPRIVETKRGRIEALERIIPAEISDQAFPGFYEQLIRKDYFEVESAYFTHIFDNSNVQTLFKESMKKYEGKADFLNLTLGLSDLSHMRPNYELWDISRGIRKDERERNLWTDLSSDELKQRLETPAADSGLESVRRYIAKYKYHSTRELDITVPNFREDPSFVIDNLKKLISVDDRCNPLELNQKQRAIFEAEKDKLLSTVLFTKRKTIESKLSQMRRFLWWREELRDVSTQMYDQLRRFTLEAARRLQRQKFFELPEDVFHFPFVEVIAMLRGDLFPGDAGKILRTNKAYFESFRHFANPPDIGFAMLDEVFDPASASYAGIACSPGICEGRARVIENIYDTDRIEQGDILVTKYTDPGWTPVFSMIAGVVTETGGVLSHAAVIAREYGIPAVLAVKNVTAKIHDGQRIRIDGRAGRVYAI